MLKRTKPWIGPLVKPNGPGEGGEELIQQQRQDVTYGFVQQYNAINPNSPYQYNSHEEYIRYKIAKYQRVPPPLQIGSEIVAFGNQPADMTTTGGTNLTFENETGDGYDGIGTPTYPIGPDDAVSLIPCDMDFYFFGTNYGNFQNGGITWNSNGALLFGTLPVDQTGADWVDFRRDTIPAILMGNFDRRQNSFYTFPITTVGNFKILKMLNFYQNYFKVNTVVLPPNNQINGGQFEIRLVKEQVNQRRQYIEIRIKSVTGDVGYSANYNTDLRLQGENHVVDPTKLSPWNITNGTVFLNPCNTIFAQNGNGPQPGQSFVFISDETGTTWQFVNGAYLVV